MLVEFAGCSGAGKSTLISEIIELADQNDPCIRLAPSQSSVAALRMAPFIFRTYREHRNLLKMAFTQIEMRVPRVLVRIRLKWNVLKTLTCFDRAKRLDGGDKIILIAEGPINLIQTIFCVGPQSIDQAAVQQLLDLASGSYILVLITANRSTLDARLKLRNRPTLPNSSEQENSEFHERVFLLFGSADTSPGLLKWLKGRIIVHCIDTSSMDSDLPRRLMDQLRVEREAAVEHA